MTMSAAPKVLVIILNYRTPQMTVRAAEAALRDMAGLAAELVIVDNASEDGSAGILTQEITARGWDKGGRVRLLLSDVNGGFGAGNNIGLRTCMSDGSAPQYFYLLNSDAFADKGCLAELLRHLENTPKAGFAGSHVRGEDDAPHTTAFRFPTVLGEFESAARFGPVSRLLHRAIVAPPLPAEAAVVDWVAGASVLIRAEMLHDIGLFDETFFLYFEETDLCRRGTDAGWDCWYVPAARVVHIGSVSTGMKEWRRIPAYWYASRRHYFIKNHGRPYAACALMAKLLGGAIHVGRSRLTGRACQDPPGFYRDLLRFGLGLSEGRTAPSAPRKTSEEKT